MQRNIKPKRRFEEEIDNRYVVDRLVGEGGFCIVLKAHKKDTEDRVAIKRMDMSKQIYKKFTGPESMSILKKLIYREADVMRSLRHENLMKLVDFIDNGVHIYLVLEYAEGGELHSKLMKVGRFKEYYAAMIVFQVMSGLDYMHKAGFVHRDIKAENVLFREKTGCRVVITDFGLSKRVTHTLKTNCGTLLYSAPELLRNRNTKKGYNSKVDNWACGILLYLLLAGYVPFDDPQFRENRITKKIMTEKLNFVKKPWPKIDREAINLIELLLERNPSNRLELEEAIIHPFIKYHQETGSQASNAQ